MVGGGGGDEAGGVRAGADERAVEDFEQGERERVVRAADGYVAYAVDKSAAQRGAWRTSEQTLHLLALLGGWPAAWWAQQWMRHKSSKASFRMVYWCTVLLHSAALGAIVWQPGWLPFSGLQ